MASPTLTFKTPDALQVWGTRFAKILKVGDTVALIGPLGAGKTTLVQSIAKALGYRRAATSPTFALANEYKTSHGVVYHMDMYRLSAAERQAFPLEDYWGEGICLVEWADLVRSRWPTDTLELQLKIKKTDERSLTVVRPTPAWQKKLRAI